MSKLARMSNLQNVVTAAPAAAPARAPRASTGNVGDAVFAGLTRIAGVFVLALLGAIIVVLFIGGLPAFRAFGVGFLFDADWDPVQNIFGAAVPIFGTIVTAIIALIVAVPISFGIAFYLTELSPPWFRQPVGTAIELLAAVPSIIYGMWGFFVIVPIMAQYIQPAVIDSLGDRAGDRRLLPGAALRHRHPDRRFDPGGDDHPVHRRHDARRVPDGAGRSTRNPPTVSAARRGR